MEAAAVSAATAAAAATTDWDEGKWENERGKKTERDHYWIVFFRSVTLRSGLVPRSFANPESEQRNKTQLAEKQIADCIDFST